MRAEPRRGLAVVTCMDARIDVLSALGLEVGDAHVIRNGGGRVTEDVVRSLVLSSRLLGVDTVVVMQHTDCALAGTTNEDLRARTGTDIDFLPIDDHETALRRDVDLLAETEALAPVVSVTGCLYDVETGRIADVVRRDRLP